MKFIDIGNTHINPQFIESYMVSVNPKATGIERTKNIVKIRMVSGDEHVAKDIIVNSVLKALSEMSVPQA